MTFVATWGCASDFFRDATKIRNGRQRATLNFFVGAKTLKLEVKNYSNFTITFPMIWRCAGDFQGFTEIQNGRHRSTLFFCVNLKKFVWSIFF